MNFYKVLFTFVFIFCAFTKSNAQDSTAKANHEKGVTSIENLHDIVLKSPNDYSANVLLADLLLTTDKDIPTFFALCRVIILGKDNLDSEVYLKKLQSLLKGDVEDLGEEGIVVNIEPIDVYSDEGASVQENDFRSASIMLSMSVALDYEKQNKRKSKAELFEIKFKNLCALLKQDQQNNYGFYWKHYVPYFTAINSEGHSEVFSNLIFKTSDDKKVLKWLKKHKDEVDAFNQWDSKYW